MIAYSPVLPNSQWIWTHINLRENLLLGHLCRNYVINYPPNSDIELWRFNTEEEIETRHLGDYLLLNTSSPTLDVRNLAWLSHFITLQTGDI
jgi:hypothetical protein